MTTRSAVTEDPFAASRRPPKREQVDLRDLSMLVRVPGRYETIRAFTDAELGDAQRHAEAVGGVIDPLP